MISTLTEKELSTLGHFLEDEAEERGAPDIFATQGLFTALAISPVPVTFEVLWEIIFELPPVFFDEKQEQEIRLLIMKLWRETKSSLDATDEFSMPCDLRVNLDDQEDFSPLESWSQGFLEGVMFHEDAWFTNNEEEIAMQLLPIHYASGLFSDEPEIQKIDDNPRLSRELCEAIPGAVMDLYLAFRVH